MEVMYLETVGNYTKIFLSNDSYFNVRSSLTAARKKLPPDVFIRVHRKYIVSIFYIQTISREDLVIDGTSISIGRLYYKPLLEKLNVME
jgi:DNA-binding LytR/AlgR family response regulator